MKCVESRCLVEAPTEDCDRKGMQRLQSARHKSWALRLGCFPTRSRARVLHRCYGVNEKSNQLQ